uniref:glycosyltransferase family 2 protein n=1 Tax=Aeromonas media TaxID=651 RepID=UPI00224028A9
MTERDEIFSIIMPCYNAESYISSSISSVINQTYPHWRLYIIDDGSTDHSYDIIYSLMSSEPRIKYIKLPHNSGVAMARNKGIREANGNYIAFLDSDDLWVDRKLELQLHFLESGYDIVCSNYMTFTDVISSPLSERFFPEKFNYRDML